MSRRVATSSIGIDFSAAVAARSAGGSDGLREMPASLPGGVGGGRAAELVVAALQHGARDRLALLAALRALGPFDEHGDPVDPAVWLWRADADWGLTPEAPLPA